MRGSKIYRRLPKQLLPVRQGSHLGVEADWELVREADHEGPGA